MSGFYLYGFVRPEATLPAPALGVAGGPVSVIAAHGLGAVVEATDITLFAASVADHGDDPAWIAARAVRHDETVAAFLPQGILPVRFGTSLADHEALERLLARESDAANARLDALRGTLEFTVRVWADRAELESRLGDAPEVSDLHAELEGASTGKAYLLHRKLRDALERHARAALPELRREAFRRLEEVSAELRVLERVPKDAGPNPGLLEVAVLLDPFSESLLRGDLAAWPDRAAMRAELSGPFAPYSFVAAPSTGAPEAVA